MARGEQAAQLMGPEAEAEGSSIAWIGAMLGLSVMAIGLGFLLGQHLAGAVKKTLQNSEQLSAPEVAPNYAGDAALQELAPIVANLADPPDAWVRLQAAIVFNGKATPKPDVMAAQIAEDILGFMRTVSLAQIGGASGLQHLREDLNERATIRSEGQVRELILQTLVVQ
jgi:flagellar protein FliL